jgi:N-acetylmuramoyl-L-alanine amidase
VQSIEYPELAFVPARSFGSGRDGKSVMYAVVHYTAGSERNDAAENGARYDQVRTDGVSTHFFHDPDSTVQCVYTWDRANAAFAKGNRLGVQHELCGTEQTRAQWLDPASDGVLWQAARWVAADCVKYGLPVRKLSPSEVRASWYSWPNGPKGICGHLDVTLAYPEDGGTHTDPGAEFPWDVFLARVQQFVDGGGDMADFTSEDTNAWHQATRIDALRSLSQKTALGEDMPIVALLARLEAKVDALTQPQIDVSELVAALKADPGFKQLLVDAANIAEDT